MIYDISNKDSFANLKLWLKELKEHGDENMLIALFANKIDL